MTKGQVTTVMELKTLVTVGFVLIFDEQFRTFVSSHLNVFFSFVRMIVFVLPPAEVSVKGFWGRGGPKRRKAMVASADSSNGTYDVFFDEEGDTCECSTAEEDLVPLSRVLALSPPESEVELSHDGLQAALADASNMKAEGNVRLH